MVEDVPSLSGEDGTEPIDPSAVSVGEVYLLEVPDEGQVEIEITQCQHGTDDTGEPQPTIIGYQRTIPADQTTGG
jgi:hypothetical protein